ADDIVWLENFQPDVPEDVDVGLVAHIGQKDSEGSDLFYFRLITPKALTRPIWAKRFLWGRGVLLVETYDFKLVTLLVSALCDRIEGESWEQVAESLGHYLNWEFNYSHPPVDLRDF
ncbi:MAG: immunity 8 family protein, partial [Chloroflexota bacterium]|nr:immunity 8 family protein [Chloroflexota bacterium]